MDSSLRNLILVSCVFVVSAPACLVSYDIRAAQKNLEDVFSSENLTQKIFSPMQQTKEGCSMGVWLSEKVHVTHKNINALCFDFESGSQSSGQLRADEKIDMFFSYNGTRHSKYYSDGYFGIAMHLMTQLRVDGRVESERSDLYILGRRLPFLSFEKFVP